MARLSTSGMNALAREMEQEPLRATLLTPKMLIAGAEVIQQGWRKSAQENKFHRTGGLISAVNFTRSPKKLNDMRYIEIYPQGKNAQGTNYAAIAFILHYGTKGSQVELQTLTPRKRARRERQLRTKKYAGRPGIPATLWVDRAEELSADTAVDEMRRIWTDS